MKTLYLQTTIVSSIRFKYIYFQIKTYNFQVTCYNNGVHFSYEMDFNQFDTTWDDSKHAIIIYLFDYSPSK